MPSVDSDDSPVSYEEIHAVRVVRMELHPYVAVSISVAERHRIRALPAACRVVPAQHVSVERLSEVRAVSAGSHADLQCSRPASLPVTILVWIDACIISVCACGRWCGEMRLISVTASQRASDAYVS